jgi:hypothetical protein
VSKGTSQAAAAFLASPPGTPRGGNLGGGGGAPLLRLGATNGVGSVPAAAANRPKSAAAWLDQPYKPDSDAVGASGGVSGGNGGSSSSGRPGRRVVDKGAAAVGATPQPEVTAPTTYATTMKPKRFLGV